MSTPAKRVRDPKQDRKNVPPRIKAQITVLKRAAESGQLNSEELDALKDEFYSIGNLISHAIAAVNQAKEIADDTETKVAARMEKEAAQAA